jgi:hypothetical protein
VDTDLIKVGNCDRKATFLVIVIHLDVYNVSRIGFVNAMIYYDNIYLQSIILVIDIIYTS